MRRWFALVAGAVVLTALVGVVARADDFWTKKQWQQWSESDCTKILKDSPWSHTYTMSKALVSADLHPDSHGTDPLQPPPVAGSAASGETKEEINYVVQLRSALPIRQAMVREMAIKQKYDKFNADQKKQFDDRAGQFLTRSYDDVIIVDVTYDSNIQTFMRALAEYWQSVPETAVPEDAHLILQNGTRISPVRFVSQKGANYEFELIFPRVQNGEPVIGANDKVLGLEFTHPDLSQVKKDFPTQRVYVEFKPEKMEMNGKMTF
ncbi:MAG TPA: hypothetical protein VFO34_16765 [Candidatus Acidoferrales bacterium]|nr:hypothetical protein [Candidatus Acidoferrales bacterium]